MPLHPPTGPRADPVDAPPVPVPQTVMAQAQHLRIAAGSKVFEPQDIPYIFLVLTSGTLRIERPTATGHPLITDRVQAGEGRHMTTASLMACAGYPGRAVAETDIDVIAMPRQAFEQLMRNSPEMRRFVLGACTRRIVALIGALETMSPGLGRPMRLH